MMTIAVTGRAPTRQMVTSDPELKLTSSALKLKKISTQTQNKEDYCYY